MTNLSERGSLGVREHQSAFQLASLRSMMALPMKHRLSHAAWQAINS
jgi:hypothetical protein